MEVVFFILIMYHFSFVYADYQGDVLYAFETGLVDPTNVLQSWDNTTLPDPCTWFHVTCSGTEVTIVDLGNGGFEGSLIPGLGNLRSLQYLELYDNKINGEKELGKLTNLVSLDLYNNKLSGPVPEELKNIPNLQVDISGNPDLCGPFTNPYKSCS